ncbi:hypothetical protein [Paenibacillus polymyxa]|uniref:hypothetical protein n=1 Tax=Paenibacillus polymyxa TaxID=1406 RepID=UPI002551F55B
MRADEEWTRCGRPIPFMFTVASEAWDSLKGTTDAPWVKWLLIGLASLVLTWLLILPLAIVLMEALKQGWGVYIADQMRVQRDRECRGVRDYTNDSLQAAPAAHLHP